MCGNKDNRNVNSHVFYATGMHIRRRPETPELTIYLRAATLQFSSCYPSGRPHKCARQDKAIRDTIVDLKINMKTRALSLANFKVIMHSLEEIVMVGQKVLRTSKR